MRRKGKFFHNRIMAVAALILSVVRGKLNVIEAIWAETTMRKIETLLQAIKMLTHGQHVRVMLLVRDGSR